MEESHNLDSNAAQGEGEESRSPIEPKADGHDGDRQMFDKPNLQLRDPDPYAFANRIRKLILLASVMACLAVAPFIARMISYEIRRGQMQAEVEVATEALGDLAPKLSGFEQASRLVSQKMGPSVVSIYRPQTQPNRRGNEGQGSGFIVDSEGFIITNEHVVRGANQLIVQFNNGEIAEASVVGTDPQTDLALIKTSGVSLPEATWGDSEGLEPGDLVWALGSPFGLERSVTFGIVSAKARRSSSMGSRSTSAYQEYLQTDAAVNPGNSGGPLVNLAGEVIGVNTAIVGESYRGVSFAIPSNIAEEMYLELRENGFIDRGYLGIRPVKLPESKRRRLKLAINEGVHVQEVVRGGPAAQAGLLPGDVILSWNDEPAEDPTLLSRAIAGTDIGSTASMLVRREVNGRSIDQTISVKVQRKPKMMTR